jgi:hypothetical protein
VRKHIDHVISFSVGSSIGSATTRRRRVVSNVGPSVAASPIHRISELTCIVPLGG